MEISCGDIFDEGPHLDAEAIVSPANSFGFMDGGIDAVYSDYFGWEIGTNLRNIINTYMGGEVLVGERCVLSHYLDTKNVRNKTCDLICAPTMRIPMNVANTPNAYLAFRTSLCWFEDNVKGSILCPGLCTATGRMSPEVCAHQMFLAYQDYNNPRQFRSLRDAAIFHDFLINPELYNDKK